MNNDTDTFKRENIIWEQREQAAQVNKHDASECSMHIPSDENKGNKLISLIRNPTDTIPENLLSPIIVRPRYMAHMDWFELNGQSMKPGVYWHGVNSDGSNVDIWICTPLIVEAITSSNADDDFGRLLRFIDSNGKWHEWSMPMHMLKGSCDELRGEILSQGAIFNPSKRSEIVKYIMSERPEKKMTSVNCVGWHNKTFVLPNQVIGTGNVIFQSESAMGSDFQTLGSISIWQENIGKLCIGNIPLMVAVSASLAGPLLRIVNRHQGGGIHFVGDSSSGKSTAVEIAASVWGPPEFIRSWSATANGLEGLAATRNDTCLILDEIDEASPQDIGKIVYMLCNGQGKQRASRIGNARKIQRWCTVALSTGERTLKSIMNDVGKDANTGQMVRLLSIPITFKYGAFSNLHIFHGGRELSDHLKKQRLITYGHIGLAFVQKLIEDKRDFPTLLEKIHQKFYHHTHNSIQDRAAGLFAVIGMAGELAIEYKLLPWHEGSALEAVVVAFQEWKNFEGIEETEEKRILRNISDFISKHGDSKFSQLGKSFGEEKSVSNRAGWYKDTEHGRVYMFFPTALLEAAGKFERARIVRALSAANWIVDSDSDNRFTKKTRLPGGGSKGLYHICEKEAEI